MSTGTFEDYLVPDNLPNRNKENNQGNKKQQIPLYVTPATDHREVLSPLDSEIQYCPIFMKHSLLDNLDDVLVGDDVFLSDPLRVVLGRRSPDQSTLEVLLQRLVNFETQIVDAVLVGVQDDRSRIVGQLAFRLRVAKDRTGWQ